MFKNLKIKCPYKCDWEGNWIDLDNHLNYPKSTSNSAAIRIQENNDFNNNAELRNKYMNEITRLNNKLKELELEKNNRNIIVIKFF